MTSLPRPPVAPSTPLWALLAFGVGLLAPAAPLQAGPVVCTTTLEAPKAAAGEPVEVSRCAPVQSTAELVESRFFTYTAPYAEGVSIRGQLRDLFGVATGSINSANSIKAFGFPDQTIIWDGTALQNTAGYLLEIQSDAMPWRTADITNGFGCSLSSPSGCRAISAPSDRGASYRTPVRGLW